MRPSRFRHAITVLAATLGLGVAPLAVGREITADQAPAAWVAYATDATQTIGGWLNAETPPAPRVRAVLEASRPAPDQPTPPLVVKLWIDEQGMITRAEFPPLSDEQADEDLHVLLVGRRLTPPPRRMRLPMRIALQLPPRPAPTPGPGQTVASGPADAPR